jgi:hypothetical protein
VCRSESGTATWLSCRRKLAAAGATFRMTRCTVVSAVKASRPAAPNPFPEPVTRPRLTSMVSARPWEPVRLLEPARGLLNRRAKLPGRRSCEFAWMSRIFACMSRVAPPGGVERAGANATGAEGRITSVTAGPREPGAGGSGWLDRHNPHPHLRAGSIDHRSMPTHAPDGRRSSGANGERDPHAEGASPHPWVRRATRRRTRPKLQGRTPRALASRSRNVARMS